MVEQAALLWPCLPIGPRAAGRSGSGQSFEETVLDKLGAIGRDVEVVKQAVSRKQR